MERFKDQYRIPSTRAEWSNYSVTGLYYITICTRGRENLFGKIENDAVILSEIGCIVDTEWQKSFIMRKELTCDTYIIMPDHIHAIVFLEEQENVLAETHSVRLHNHHLRRTAVCLCPWERKFREKKVYL